MPINADEVRVAGAGHVYVAPAGTALPTSPSAALSAAWTDLGYVTEDGVTFTFNRETTDLNAWQGDKLRVLTTAEPAEVSFALMQSNDLTLPIVFGGGTVTEESSGVYKFTPPASGTNTERALVVEFSDNTINYRYCISRVQISGEVSFTLTRGEALSYPLTFGILDDDPKYVILTDDSAWDVTTS